jgi:hypothetical protein
MVGAEPAVHCITEEKRPAQDFSTRPAKVALVKRIGRNDTMLSRRWEIEASETRIT